MVSSIQTCESDISSKLMHDPYRASNSIFYLPSSEIEVYGLRTQIKSHKAKKAINIEFRFASTWQ